MNGNELIRELVREHGEKEFLDWAAAEGIKPTYNAALYWLVEFKGLRGEVKI